MKKVDIPLEIAGERAKSVSFVDSTVARGVNAAESAQVHGQYDVRCVGPVESERGRYVLLRDGINKIKRAGRFVRFLNRKARERLERELATIPLESKWQDTVRNLVTTVGKNKMLDEALAGSAYTATWYMGLIGAVSYTTGPAVGDTMSSHGGWTEAGAANAPTYSQGSRPTAAWSSAAAGAKALSAALTFSITSSGTAKGAFLNSVATKDGTTGVLYSAGLFTGGDKTVTNGDTLSASYTSTLT
jgi:hypothetical protein